MILVAFLWDPMKIELSQAKEPASVLGSLASFAWPLITLLILYLYRDPLSTFLIKIGERATEIGIGSWASIKLPEVKEAPPNPISVLRELTTDRWEESSGQWFHEFASSTATSEYALLDLGDGQQWISSRLFIFAVMLQRMKALKCIVFVVSQPDGTRRFIGCATPDNVRWALATNQPWLEVAYAQSYSQVMTNQSMPGSGLPPPTRIDGSIVPFVAEDIVRTFIRSLKIAPAILPDPQNWVNLPNGSEHATWLEPLELQRLFGAYLWKDSVEGRTDDTPEEKRLEMKHVISKSVPYVAILKDGAYKSLCNRLALLAEIGQSIL
jgi:hypothetical protein